MRASFSSPLHILSVCIELKRMSAEKPTKKCGYLLDGPANVWIEIGNGYQGRVDRAMQFLMLLCACDVFRFIAEWTIRTRTHPLHNGRMPCQKASETTTRDAP